MSEGLTHDAFLEGKLNIWQPTDGYRAGTDAVFLAAAVQAQSGESVFEIGCGVGTASLCLAKRINGLDLTGLEIQPEMAALARRNAVENKLDLEVIEGDIHALPRDLRQLNFDHVIANPPYFETKKLTEPRAKAKKLAHVAQAGELSAWVALGAKRLKPRGRITLIHLAESLPEVLSSLDGPCGAIEIIPIISRANQKAGRVIVTAVKGARAPLELHAPKIVHAGPVHIDGVEDYSNWATDVLRKGSALR